jgi:hypothetical protein
MKHVDHARGQSGARLRALHRPRMRGGHTVSIIIRTQTLRLLTFRPGLLFGKEARPVCF